MPAYCSSLSLYRGEGWGLPIAEAMALEVPVIVTNYSGIKVCHALFDMRCPEESKFRLVRL
jgi:hypothetical protein